MTNLKSDIEAIINSEKYSIQTILDEDMLVEDLKALGYKAVNCTFGAVYAENPENGKKYYVNLENVNWK